MQRAFKLVRALRNTRLQRDVESLQIGVRLVQGSVTLVQSKGYEAGGRNQKYDVYGQERPPLIDRRQRVSVQVFGGRGQALGASGDGRLGQLSEPRLNVGFGIQNGADGLKEPLYLVRHVGVEPLVATEGDQQSTQLELLNRRVGFGEVESPDQQLKRVRRGAVQSNLPHLVDDLWPLFSEEGCLFRVAGLLAQKISDQSAGLTDGPGKALVAVQNTRLLARASPNLEHLAVHTLRTDRDACRECTRAFTRRLPALPCGLQCRNEGPEIFTYAFELGDGRVMREVHLHGNRARLEQQSRQQQQGADDQADSNDPSLHGQLFT